MDSSNLKEHLDLLKMKDIKNLIRQYNLHYKIKLSQNKPDLISDLLKHFEEYTINDNKITLKSKQYDFIKMDEPKPTAPQKPRIKKDKKEDIKIKKDERMNTLIESLKSIKSKTKEDDAVIKKAQNEIEYLKAKKKEVIKKVAKEAVKDVIKEVGLSKIKLDKQTVSKLQEDLKKTIMSIKNDKSLTEDEQSKKIFYAGVRDRTNRKSLKDDIILKNTPSNRLHIKIIVPSKTDDGYVPNFNKLTKLEQLNIVLKTSTITGKAPKKSFYVEIADEFYKNINTLLNRSPYSAVKELVDKYQLTAENLKKMYAAKSSSDFFPTGYEMVKQIFSNSRFSKNEYNMLEGTAGIGGVGYWAKRMNKNLNITMNELDKNNYDIMKLFNNEDDNIDLMNDDFFKLNNNRGYDLIFLNPPFGSIANKNPNFWFLFLLQALHLLKDVKGPSYILFISPQLIRPRQNSDSKDVQFLSLFDLIKGYKQDSDQEGLLLANRWLNYINKFSGKSFTSTDIEKGFYDREGKLYDYIEDNFKIQYAVSVPLKSTDFGGTKLQAYYTLFELYN